LQYAGGGGAVDGESVARYSLEAGMAGPAAQWEDEMDPGLEGAERAERAERAKIDDRTD